MPARVGHLSQLSHAQRLPRDFRPRPGFAQHSINPKARSRSCLPHGASGQCEIHLVSPLSACCPCHRAPSFCPCPDFALVAFAHARVFRRRTTSWLGSVFFLRSSWAWPYENGQGHCQRNRPLAMGRLNVESEGRGAPKATRNCKLVAAMTHLLRLVFGFFWLWFGLA